MPRKRADKDSAFKNFALTNLDFSHDDRIQINDFIAAMKIGLNEMLLEIVDAGFKISWSYDAYHECYTCSLTHKSSSRKAKPVYVFRHNDLFKLIGVGYYVFVIMLVRGDSELPDESTMNDW